jgi:hypothetical protein
MHQLIGNGRSSIYHTRSFTSKPTEKMSNPTKIHVLQIHPFSGWGHSRRRQKDPSVRLQMTFDGLPTPRFHILKIEKVVGGDRTKNEVIFEAGLCLDFFKDQFCKGLLNKF